MKKKVLAMTMMAAMTAAAIAPAASAEEDKVVKLALQGDSLTWQQEIVDKFEAETGYKVEPILIPADQDIKYAFYLMK